ncbi:hypothetical protein RND81_11G115200 [Saponaria officinalis]|uniref:Uncharacterized protein n=1 Tax=Saponaria officinalis TaxID=3572 RepID=A0AAW1HMJ5_SAPOF
MITANMLKQAISIARGDGNAQASRISAWVWTGITTLFAILGCVFLRGTIQFHSTGGPSFFLVRGYTPASTVIYAVLVVSLFVVQVTLAILAPRLRLMPWVRAPQPPVYLTSIVGVFAMVVPIICSEYMLDDPTTSISPSLLASLFFTLDFFSIHLAILPAFDFQIVPCSLSVVATIFTFCFRNSSQRIIIYITGVIGLFAYLQWYTVLIRRGPVRLLVSAGPGAVQNVIP